MQNLIRLICKDDVVTVSIKDASLSIFVRKTFEISSEITSDDEGSQILDIHLHNVNAITLRRVVDFFTHYTCEPMMVFEKIF